MKKVIQVAKTFTNSDVTMLGLEAADGTRYWFPKRKYKYWRVPDVGELVAVSLANAAKNDWRFIAPSQSQQSD